MCEITSENFYSVLPVIEAEIKKCAFISFDMEFSKLHEHLANPFTYFDTSEERYSKLREKVSDITCIQLGIAIFIHDANKKTFKTSSYSFYTYPQTFYKSESVVQFQTSSVEFLCKHKFDFNKLFHHRVPYLTDEQEMTVNSEMKNSLFFDKYFDTNLKFRSIEEELIKTLNIVSEWYYSAKYGENTFLEINGCNEPAYIILMQYYLLKKFKYLNIDENQLGLTITKLEENTSAEIVNNQIKEKLKQCLLDKMLGIKYLLKLISNLKKPIIGHNCSLDILILCNQFFKPLPESFKDYQSFVTYNFGPIYDTKLLCKEIKFVIPKTDKWLGNSLSDIYSFLKYGDAKVYGDLICIELTNIEEAQNMKLHHAGWDAYYTGYCFVKMMHIIKKFSNKTVTIGEKYTWPELLKSVEYFKNKLYTCRSITNSIDLNEDDHNYQTNYFTIQNKGILFRALDFMKLKHELKQQFFYFDMKLLSKYTALIVIPFKNKHTLYNLSSKYRVEEYSHYQSRKRKQKIIGLSLFVVSTSIAIIVCLRK